MLLHLFNLCDSSGALVIITHDLTTNCSVANHLHDVETGSELSHQLSLLNEIQWPAAVLIDNDSRDSLSDQIGSTAPRRVV